MRTTRDEVKAIKSDLKHLRNDMMNLMKSMRHDGHGWRDRMGSAMRDGADAVRDHASAMGEMVGEKAQLVRKTAGQHPLSTAAAALGLGLLTGMLLHHCRS